ncbi:hypothetical protein [Bifidobacterium mongoliense]|uniref:hypothetical protein n=1 Tax=Bifidobacterium mongoliense TaxID=518643 RepID=UPI0030ECA04C
MKRTLPASPAKRQVREGSGRQINLLIPVDQHKAFKRYAVEHDTSMSDLLRQWIAEHVQEPQRTKKGAEL